MTKYEFSTLIDQLVKENFRKTSREYENNIIAVNGGTAYEVSSLPYSSSNSRIINSRLVLRHDSLSNWMSSDVRLLEGEPAISYEFNRFDGTKSTYRMKIGKKDPNGNLYKWSELPYMNIDISDVVGLSVYLSSLENTRYKLSSDDNITLSLLYTDDALEPYTWHDTGDRFSVSNINDKLNIVTSDYTTSALVSSIVTGYTTDINISVAGISSSVSSFSNSWKSSVDLSIAGISSTIKNDYWKKTETSSASEISSEFKKYQLSGDYTTSALVSSITILIMNSYFNVFTELSDIGPALRKCKDINTAKTLLLGKTFYDTWTDYDSTGIGDASISQKDGHPIWYDPLVITDIRNVTDMNGNTHMGAVLMRLYAATKSMCFDLPNREIATESVAQSNMTYYGFKNNAYTILSLTPGGTIPYSSYEAIYVNSIYDNSYLILQGGHNSYKYSIIRQYLNSSGYSWWKLLHRGQVNPNYSFTGYKSGCSTELLSVVKKVKHNTMRNNACDGFGIDELYDEFFLVSNKELFYTTEGQEGTEQFEYWRKLLNSSTANPGSYTEINNLRKAYRVNNKSSLCNIHTRTATSWFSMYAWIMLTDGSFVNGNIVNANCEILPACVIY